MTREEIYSRFEELDKNARRWAAVWTRSRNNTPKGR